MGTVLEVVAGEALLSDLILDVLVETHEKGDVASFRHNGKKKKGIVIGKKGEHLVVARGRERHVVKNGESQRMIEAAETVEPLEIEPIYVDSVLDEAAEAMDDDGTVDLAHPLVVERLTPRQMRFLFATGAFKAGKAAAKAVRAVAIPAPSRSDFGRQFASLPQQASALRARQAISSAVRHTAARAAAKQAMQQQLRSYKAAKSVGYFGLRHGKPFVGMKQRSVTKGELGLMRWGARMASRAAVK